MTPFVFKDSDFSFLKPSGSSWPLMVHKRFWAWHAREAQWCSKGTSPSVLKFYWLQFPPVFFSVLLHKTTMDLIWFDSSQRLMLIEKKHFPNDILHSIILLNSNLSSGTELDCPDVFMKAARCLVGGRQQISAGESIESMLRLWFLAAFYCPNSDFFNMPWPQLDTLETCWTQGSNTHCINLWFVSPQKKP